MAKRKKVLKPIGIIGLGMVGGQLYRWFELEKYPVVGYDKFKEIGDIEDLQDAKIIFLCLPTPHKNTKDGIDFAPFEEIIKKFKKSKIFIIKSTITPGTTDKFQNKFKKHYFFHSPEFLTEETAWEDFSNPDAQLIGFTKKSKRFAKDILEILPKARYSAVIPATSTELFKFARNCFFATKVIFANHIYDLCKTYRVDYEDIRRAMQEDPWIQGNHLNVLHKNFRGFGGKCLPKDLKTFIKTFESQKVDGELFKAVDRVNERLLKKQKLMGVLKKYWLNNSNNI